jgi:hypothetical protein
MKISWPFIYVLLWGYLILSGLFTQNYKSRLPLLERLGLSYLLGSGFITLGLFLMDYFGVPLRPGNILGMIWAGISILAVLSVIRNREGWKKIGSSFIPSFSMSRIGLFLREKKNWFAVFLLLILAVQVIFIFLEAWIRPFYTWDDIETWGFKGKAIFETQKICWEYFHFSRFQYPLHLPLLQGFVSILIGEWNEAAVRTIAPLYYVSLLSVFFYEMRRYTRLLTSCLACLLLATLPELAFHATIAYADLTLAIYHSVGAFFLTRWFLNKDKEDLICWGIFGAFAIWTKLEGFMFFMGQGLVIAFYFYRTRDWKQIKYFAINLILPFLFYVITRYSHHDYYPTFVDERLRAFGFYPERFNWVFDYFGQSAFIQGTWSFLWAGLLFYPFKVRELWKSSFNYSLLLLAIYLILVLTFWAFIGTEKDIYYAYVSCTLNRTLNSVVILLVFFHAILFEKITEQAFRVREKAKPAWQSKGNSSRKRK